MLIEPVDLEPISMLTVGNLWQESVLEPEPLFKEPIIK